MLRLIHQGNIKTIFGNNKISLFLTISFFIKKIHDFMIIFCNFKRMIG